MLTRLSHSHIRFGTFQRHAYLDRADLIGQLVDHVVEIYYPEPRQRGGPSRRRCSRRCWRAPPTSSARWMAAGFVHGVLNTDNMNITGESFDYGPYRFLPRNDPNFVAAYFDQTGPLQLRPPAGGGVLEPAPAGRRADAWSATAEPLVEALNGFSAAYRDGAGGGDAARAWA